MTRKDADSPKPEKAKPTPPPPMKPADRIVMLVGLPIMLLILIDPTARDFAGRAAGAALGPTIGFGDAAPAMTLVLAGLLMMALTTWVRHYFTDYLKMARNAEIMKAFSKEMREARKENNLQKMKKLTDKNRDVMALQSEASNQQLKSMPLTMIVVVPIFAWLAVFVAAAAVSATVLHPDTGAVPLDERSGTLAELVNATAAPANSTKAVRLSHFDIGPASAGATLQFNATIAVGNIGSSGTLVAAPSQQLMIVVEVEGQRALSFASVTLESGQSINFTGVIPAPHASARIAVRAIDPCVAARVPWDSHWCLEENVKAPIPLLSYFPRWVALYSVVSIPTGQLLSRLLKIRWLRAELAKQQGAGSPA